ncbi:MAG: trypsin-like serine protease [Labilithrix sp.]
MVAPNLALTARHCVSNADLTAACDVSGRTLSGGEIGADFEPASLNVFTGPARPPGVLPPDAIRADQWSPAARGVTIFHDRSDRLCAHDLALLLLDRPLSTPIASLRLDGDAKAGEGATVIGWGIVNDRATGYEPPGRQTRDVEVFNVGPQQTQQLVLTAAELSLRGESICEGDSGGPVMARDSGAVIGVVSRGDNQLGGPGLPKGASCVGPGEYNVATKLSPFRAVFDRAFAAAGAQPRPEVRADGEGGICDCRVGGDPTDTLSAVLVSLFWLLRVRRTARRHRCER